MSNPKMKSCIFLLSTLAFQSCNPFSIASRLVVSSKTYLAIPSLPAARIFKDLAKLQTAREFEQWVRNAFIKP